MGLVGLVLEGAHLAGDLTVEFEEEAVVGVFDGELGWGDGCELFEEAAAGAEGGGELGACDAWEWVGAASRDSAGVANGDAGVEVEPGGVLLFLGQVRDFEEEGFGDVGMAGAARLLDAVVELVEFEQFGDGGAVFADESSDVGLGVAGSLEEAGIGVGFV